MAEADNYAVEKAVFRFSLLYLFLHFGAFLAGGGAEVLRAWGAGRWRFRPEHEIHKRRFGRNLGLGLTLAAFVALVFALTVVKVTRGEPMQGYDHVGAARSWCRRRQPNELSATCRARTGRRPSWSAWWSTMAVAVLCGGAVLRLVLPGDRLWRHHSAWPKPAPDVILDQTIRCASTPRSTRACRGIQARAARDDAADRRNRAGLLRGLQPDRPVGRGHGQLQRDARCRGRLFHQDRLFLL